MMIYMNSKANIFISLYSVNVLEGGKYSKQFYIFFLHFSLLVVINFERTSQKKLGQYVGIEIRTQNDL